MFRNPWRYAARVIQEQARGSTVQASCLEDLLHTCTWCSSVHITQYLFSKWASSNNPGSVAVFLFTQGEQLKSGSVPHPTIMCVVLDHHQEYIVGFSITADHPLASNHYHYLCYFRLGFRTHSGRKTLSLLRVLNQQYGGPIPMVSIQQKVLCCWLYFIHR